MIIYNFCTFEGECSPSCLLFDFQLNCAINQSNNCDCASGTGGNQDQTDGRKWTAVGTKETKHIGGKIRKHTYLKANTLS